jgi:CheY-like chemotaxis protein
MTEAASCYDILLVEDDQMIRESLSDALQFEGFIVTTAENGADALEKLQQIKHPCLILLDLMMPVMNGWEFLAYRQKDDVLITIPVAVVTAAADNSIKKAGGVQGVFKKPINISALFDWIKKYCGDPANTTAA